VNFTEYRKFFAVTLKFTFTDMRTKNFIIVIVAALLASLGAKARTVNLTKAGTLKDTADMASVTHLALTGQIDARDVKYMRDNMLQLVEVDLSGATVIAYQDEDEEEDEDEDEGEEAKLNVYPANEMPQSSFYNKTSLTSVKLPADLTSIGNQAFHGCSGLADSLAFPENLTSIGSSAFYGCSGLTDSLTFPESLTTIGSSAFYGCRSLTGSLAFPESLTTIGSSAFYGCSGLTGNLSIPESLTTIGSSAFNGCSGLTGSLTFPAGVDTIGDAMFMNCTNLTEISFPADLTTIGDHAFSGCTNLTEISFPADLTTIGSHAFYGCSELTEISFPAGLTSIGSSAFEGCSGLTGSLLLPESLTSIGSYAFASCSGFTDSLSFPADLTSIDSWAFSGCTNLTEISLPAGLTSVSEWAFYGCSGLEEISFPAGLTAIGDGAFRECSSLEKILLPAGLTSIGSYAFDSCTNLTEISFPEGLTSIGSYAFADCRGLEEISFPAGLTSIGSYAFDSCTSLASVTNLSLAPQEVNSDVFEGVTIGGVALTVPASAVDTYKSTEVWGMFNPVEGGNALLSAKPNSKALGSVTGAPEGLYSAGTPVTLTATPADGCTFFSWTSGSDRLGTELALTLTMEQDRDMVITANFGKIYNLAEAGTLQDTGGIATVTHFALTGSIDARDVKHMRDAMTALVELDLSGASVALYKGVDGTQSGDQVYPANKMPQYSFYNGSNGKTSLTSVKLPTSLTSIGDNAFEGCSGLADSLSLPAGLTSIGSSAFEGCSNLAGSLSLPEGIDSIGSSAFEGCSGLAGSLSLPAARTSIGSSAFEGCSGLAGSLSLPEGLTSIGSSAFEGCSSLAGSLSLPAGLTSIEDKVFMGCSDLTGSLSLPQGLTSIGSSAFENCSLLTGISFPEGLTSIGDNAFMECSSLEDISFPEGLTSIGSYAFKGCSGLAGISFPEGLTSIGGYAFASCTSLASVTNLRLTPQHIDSDVFGGVAIEGVALTVPASAAGAYKGTEVWRMFDLAEGGDVLLSAKPNSRALGSVTGQPEGLYPAGESVTLTATPADGCIFFSWTSGSNRLGTEANLDLNLDRDMVITANFGKVYNLAEAGTLQDVEGIATVTHLVLTGSIDARDVKHMRDNMPLLVELDLSGATVALHEGADGTQSGDQTYPANEMPQYSFYNGATGKTSLTSVKLPTSLTSIGNNAFEGCTGLTDSLSLPEDIATIGSSAFEGCSHLTGISFPEGLTTIGSSAFEGCSHLTGISFPEGLTTIGSSALKGCTDLAGSLSFPESLITIGSSAFEGCSHLTGISFSEGLTTIGDSAFYGCTDLAGNLSFPESLTTIGSSAFEGCSNLTDISIPAGLTAVGSYAFYGCSNLTSSLSFPAGIAAVGSYAFYGCSLLADISFSKGLISIGEWAFYGCSLLTNISFPEDLTAIGSSAFAFCTGLTDISFPESLTSIGGYAFESCTSLASVTNLRLEPQNVSSSVFGNVTIGSIPLKVPTAAVDAYKEAEVWSGFKSLESVVTVTFESNGGSPVEQQTIENGTAIPQPVDHPARTGYSFEGWCKDEALAVAWNFETGKVTENMTLYAKWLIKSYTVTFESNGGSPVGQQVIDSLKTVAAPADPARTGYTFEGWYKDEALTAAWDFSADKVTAGTTLYAKWLIKRYTVTFVSSGGSSVGQQAIDSLKTAAEPAAPTRTGYTFEGWYRDKALTAAWSFETDTVTADTTLYAKWLIKRYAVTFESNGSSEVAPQLIDSLKTVAAPAAPARTGYTFEGWYKDEALAVAWNFETGRVTENMTLYAKWLIKRYAVTFESNGGSPVGQQVIDSLKTVAAPADPARTGYTFEGWYKDVELTAAWSFETDTVTANATLYAKWLIKRYTVTFVSNGGSSAEQQIIDSLEAVAPPAAPARTGYTFEGWYRNEALTAAWNFSADKVTADTTLYAKWLIKRYTVTFDGNGGSGSSLTPQIRDSLKTVATPAAPARPGYTFEGWYSDTMLTVAWNFASDAVTKNMTLYAKWLIKIHTVTFESNNGNDGSSGGISPQTVAHGAAVAKPDDPTRTGYSLDGWYRNEALTAEWDFETGTVTGSMTLYAKWRAQPATGVERHTLGVVKVYPNPTSGTVTIESNGEALLYSLQGTLLKRASGNRLDLSAYPAGVYVLRAGSKTARIVKQ
jgi:uncharacterized repeat protein (TIGR02543 family)